METDHHVPAARTDGAPVRVAVETCDPLGGHGLALALAEAPELSLTEPADCDVLVLLTDRVDDRLLTIMRERFHARSSGISCIVIANEISEEQVSEAAGLGLIALLQRAGAAPGRVRESVVLTRSVRPPLPSPVLSAMLQQFHEVRGATEMAGSLSDLEAKILLRYGDGLGTADIGRQLGLTPPRINRIVGDVCRRLDLRSREHAVAYAVRRGLDELRRSGASSRLRHPRPPGLE